MLILFPNSCAEEPFTCTRTALTGRAYTWDRWLDLGPHILVQEKETLNICLLFKYLQNSSCQLLGYCKYESQDDRGLQQCCEQLLPFRWWLKVMVFLSLQNPYWLKIENLCLITRESLQHSVLSGWNLEVYGTSGTGRCWSPTSASWKLRLCISSTTVRLIFNDHSSCCYILAAQEGFTCTFVAVKILSILFL